MFERIVIVTAALGGLCGLLVLAKVIREHRRLLKMRKDLLKRMEEMDQ